MDDHASAAGGGSRKLFSRADILIIGCVFLAALAVMGMLTLSRPSEPAVCQILYDNRVVRAVPLDKDQVFALPQNPHVIFRVKNGAIAFIASDCPDKICVKTGFISHTGQMAACLPNRVAIKIVATGTAKPPAGDEPDVIAR